VAENRNLSAAFTTAQATRFLRGLGLLLWSFNISLSAGSFLQSNCYLALTGRTGHDMKLLGQIGERSHVPDA